MRLLLVLTLLNGLVPALGEIAESVVHYALDGHLAHSDADRGDHGDQGCERGCGTNDHHCLCCASQPMAAPVAGAVIKVAAVVSRPHVAAASLASLDAPAPPLRPPIAS